MAADITALISDLAAESAELDAVLAPLPAVDWLRPTPAAGWTIADQVSHLAYFDQATLLSITDPDQFRAQAAALTAGGDNFPDRVAAQFRHLGGAELLPWFQAARRALLDGYAAADPARRLPWFGPDMGLASSVTARLMETWAHAQDVCDALGAGRAPTSRLRHVAHIGIGARAYSFAVNGLDPPAEPVRVELAAPDGSQWAWGPDDAVDRVSGPALDFCLLVTQRRHRDDVSLAVTGPAATAWMAVAQAFAGPPGPGRAPAAGRAGQAQQAGPGQPGTRA
jgi:uncharacterized protein (TIGR03084 family)